MGPSPPPPPPRRATGKEHYPLFLCEHFFSKKKSTFVKPVLSVSRIMSLNSIRSNYGMWHLLYLDLYYLTWSLRDTRNKIKKKINTNGAHTLCGCLLIKIKTNYMNPHVSRTHTTASLQTVYRCRRWWPSSHNNQSLGRVSYWVMSFLSSPNSNLYFYKVIAY